MQTVKFASAIETAYGITGYSCLRETYSGTPERITVLMLRSAEGYTQTVLFLPAAQVREAF